MIQSAEARLDGNTLVLRIPMRVHRRGGRKRIVAPDGSAIVPTSKPQPDGTLVKALARAWRWQRMLHAGVYTSVTEIAEAELIGKEFRTGWPDGDRRTRSSSRRLLVDDCERDPPLQPPDWVTISCSA